MVSTIVENIKDKFISIKHIGLVKEMKKSWRPWGGKPGKGGLENYLYSETAEGCLLRIEMDMNEEFKSYFEDLAQSAGNHKRTGWINPLGTLFSWD